MLLKLEVNSKDFFKKEQDYFLKTHNSLEEYFFEQFTNLNNTLGVIYIVRDPRNVIQYLSFH